MVAKELGVHVDDSHGGVFQGAVLMGAAFGLGAAVSILPFLILPLDWAVPAAVVATGTVLFAIGVIKSRWTGRSASPLGAGPGTCGDRRDRLTP